MVLASGSAESFPPTPSPKHELHVVLVTIPYLMPAADVRWVLCLASLHAPGCCACLPCAHARLPPPPSPRTLTHTVRVRITVQHHEVRDEDPQLPEMQVVVARWMERMGAEMDKVLGTLPVALDCYFASVRTKETNTGNLLADICRESAKVCDSEQLPWGRGARTVGVGGGECNCYEVCIMMIRWRVCVLQADLAIINSGTIRADRVLGPGPFTMRDLLTLLPFDDAIMLLGMVAG